MNLNTTRREILLGTASTFSKRELCEKNTSQAVCPPVEHLYKNSKIKIHSDQKYIDALLNNNTLLLNELYEKFSGKIKSMVLQNNGTESDAADIFQDALVSVYHRATKGFVLNCPFEGFLYLICKNRWINELSKRKYQKTKFTDTENYENIQEEVFIEMEECHLQQARKDLLTEKLAELSKCSQELLRLTWSGKSLEEVARILNVSYGYTRKKKSEAMTKLIQLIKQSPKFDALKW